jgi:4-amino-4-deoxy-L-arabinose transferase-like glycosyltransferase
VKRWARRQVPTLVLLLFAFGVRVWHLEDQSLWYDEAYIWWATTEVSFSKMLTLSVREIIPPGYYIMIRAWAPLAGTTEFALRFPSALLGVVGIAAAGRLAGRLTGSRLAQDMALALTAIGTPLVWAAREVRMYGPLLTWTLLADMALIETLRSRTMHRVRRWTWLWAGATLMALYTLVLSGFWLIGQMLFAAILMLTYSKSRLRSWLKQMALPGVGVTLLYLPWVLSALQHLNENAGYWAGYLPISAFFRTAIQGMTVSDFWMTSQIEQISLVLLSASLLALLIALHRPHIALYPLCSIVPLLIMALIFRRLPKWGTRHAVLFAPMPPLTVALTWGTVRTWPKGVPRRLTVGILTLITVVTVGLTLRADAYLLWDPTFAHEDWRGAAEYVQKQRTADDVVIVETGSVFPAWAYYAGWQGLLPLPDDELLNVDHVLHYTNTAPTLRKALQGASDVWVVDWLGHVTDPTGLVPALLTYKGQEQPVPAFHGLTVQQFTLTDTFELPPDPPTTAQPQREMLPNLTLWGHDTPATMTQGHLLKTRFWWTTDDPSAHKDAFYQVLVQIQDSKGNEWGRVDTTPGGGDYRPEHWPTSTPILGQITLPVDAWAPPGLYTPTVKVYTEDQSSRSFNLTPITLTTSKNPPPLPADVQPVSRQGAAAPLALLGVKLDAQDITPCGTLAGRLFWEIQQSPQKEYLLTVTGGNHQQMLRPAPTFAEQTWRIGDRFATPFKIPVDCRALDQEAPFNVSLHPSEDESPIASWTGPEIAIVAGRTFTPPDEMTALNVEFRHNFATLVGYRLEPHKPRANEPFTLTLVWRAGETGNTPYTTFVHVTQPHAMQPIAQHDSWPKMGLKPTNTWAPQEIIVDRHPLPGLPAGSYTLRIGLYNPEGIRLQRAGGGPAGSKDRLDLPLSIDSP